MTGEQPLYVRKMLTTDLILAQRALARSAAGVGELPGRFALAGDQLKKQYFPAKRVAAQVFSAEFAQPPRCNVCTVNRVGYSCHPNRARQGRASPAVVSGDASQATPGEVDMSMKIYHVHGVCHQAVIFATSHEEAVAQAIERKLAFHYHPYCDGASPLASTTRG